MTKGARSGSGAGSSSDPPRVAGRRGREESGAAPPSPPLPAEARPRARLFHWSKFDIQISLPKLRSYVPTAVLKYVRKLYLRWRRTSEPKMRAILSR
eukprot:5737070-Pyramimonas_sp.AAC.1